MISIRYCECGECHMNNKSYCVKCGEYRGASLPEIIDKLKEALVDLEKLNKHLIKEEKKKEELSGCTCGQAPGNCGCGY